MTKKEFIKEIKDYSSIFAFMCIIFMVFHNNMTFAKGNCVDQDAFTALDRCRENKIISVTDDIKDVDIDGNKTVICDKVEWDTFNPYTDEEYYYEQKNSWCLAWGLGVSLPYAVFSLASSFSCLGPQSAPDPEKTTKKLTKLQELKKGWEIFKQVMSGTVQVAGTGAASVFTNPIIAVQAALALDILMLTITMFTNVTACTASVGTMANACTMIGVCVGWIIGLTATAQLLIFSTSSGLYESSKMQINNIKVCGDDWFSYAYTGYDMKRPKIEWYPQFDSFSNSYSYKVKRALSGEYTCSGYLIDDTKHDKTNDTNKKTELKNCPSSCAGIVKKCLKENRTYDGSGDAELCSLEAEGCSKYCREYYLKCEPMLDVLDGDGICVNDPYSSVAYNKLNCKKVKPNYKMIRNRAFREMSYRGKEFRIAIDDGITGTSNACYDPRLPEDRGYGGLEQRYYFKGKDSGQYGCTRFKYNNGTGCLIYSDGKTKVITSDEVIADKAKSEECEQAFYAAEDCCKTRQIMGICIYAKEGKLAGRNTNTMCLKSLDASVEPNKCSLPTGEVSIRDPSFTAYTPETSSTLTCIKNVNFCPYTYNVAGGTELEELYCDGDYINCNNPHDTNDDRKCDKEDSDKTKCEKWNQRYGKDKDKIWKKERLFIPTESYGQTKNFCYYKVHCTEMGETDYKFVDLTGNKFLPDVCSNFVGDSQNLPTPVTVFNLNTSSAITGIFQKLRIDLGDSTPKSISQAISKMTDYQVAMAYSQIIIQQGLLSVATGLVGGLSGGLAGIIAGVSTGLSYTISDIQDAVQGEANARKTLNSITNTLLNKRTLNVNFDMGSYRGFTAPIAQCLRETLYNMFNNIAGRSLCKDSTEGINSEGLCGNDTFGPPIKIRNEKFNSEFVGENDAYFYVIYEPLPPDSNIFYKLQSRIQLIIKLAAVIAIILIALKFLMKGDVDIFDIKKPKAVIVGMLKFAIVFYFSIGNAWQSQFYDWVDKGSQYLYYKAFNLALVNYDGYRNTANKVICTKKDIKKTCNSSPEKKESVIFNYAANEQTFTVPDGVTNIKISGFGGVGGAGVASNAGLGGYTYGNLVVNSGDIIKIKTGGAGGIGIAGYNGGGNAGDNTSGGGGGRTEISRNGVLLMVAAGGGGGAGAESPNDGGAGGGYFSGGESGKIVDKCGGAGGKDGVGGNNVGDCLNAKFNVGGDINGGNGVVFDGRVSGAGGGGYGGGASGALNHGGGGGGSYINSILKDVGGSIGLNNSAGKVELYYIIPKTPLKCETEEVVTNAFEVEGMGVLSDGKSETCRPADSVGDSSNVTRQVCYSNCVEIQKFDEEGSAVYEYSPHYDGCYFGDNNYPSGKQYLAIFDSLDCKLMNYFNYGPDMDLPGIIHMLLISLFFGPLALVTFIIGALFFVIMVIIVAKVLYTFLMSMIAINIMIYVSPLIFPSILFEKYKSIFDKWLNNFMSFCLQFIFVVIYAGFFIGTFERLSVGSAEFVGHDPATGRRPIIVCKDSIDGVLCIFKVNTNKGTQPLAGEVAGKILGLGPLVSAFESITQDFFGVLLTLFKFCLITFVLLQFLKKIPQVAAELTGGKALNGGDVDLIETMKKIHDTAEGVLRGAKGLAKKGVSGLKGLDDKRKSAKKLGEDYKNNKDEGEKKPKDDKDDKVKNLDVKKQDGNTGGAPAGGAAPAAGGGGGGAAPAAGGGGGGAAPAAGGDSGGGSAPAGGSAKSDGGV